MRFTYLGLVFDLQDYIFDNSFSPLVPLNKSAHQSPLVIMVHVTCEKWKQSQGHVYDDRNYLMQLVIGQSSTLGRFIKAISTLGNVTEDLTFVCSHILGGTNTNGRWL